MEKRPIVPSNCFFQGSYNPIFEAEIIKCKDKCFRYNSLLPSDIEGKDALIRQILGKAGKGAVIGDDTVIGAGSVVKGEIPAGVLAVGVPCKVKRKITEEDKRRYPTYTGEYI